jgi:uncharacterized repeat protein (TIGR03847 family)
VSLKLEKEQVLFLAGGLTEVMADLAAPAAVPTESELELEQPVLPEWAVGSMQLAYDSTADRVLLVAREIAPDEEGNPEETGASGSAPAEEGVGSFEVGATWPASEDELPDPGPAAVARVALTREQAAGVIEHGKRLLRRGRPPCPLCGFPLTDDHSCPKTNGHRAPAL